MSRDERQHSGVCLENVGFIQRSVHQRSTGLSGLVAVSVCLSLSKLTALQEHRIILEADSLDGMPFSLVWVPVLGAHDLQQRP